MGKSSPAQPDPAATAHAQGATDIMTAIAQGYLNRTNQVSPFGTSTYKRTGTQKIFDPTHPNAKPYEVPTFQQSIKLSPDQQRMLRNTNAINLNLLRLGRSQLGRVEESLGSDPDLSGLPALAGSGDFSADRGRVEEALMSRLDPQFARDREELASQLANQGFARGSEGWKNATDELDRARTDARFQAVLAGGQEQSRLAGLTNATRQQGLQELLGLREQPLNELLALSGQAGNVQLPQFAPPPQAGLTSPDYMGAVYKNYEDRLKASSAASGGMTGLVGALGAGALASPWLGAALGFASDPTLKTDRAPVADAAVLDALRTMPPTETWRYRGDPTPRIGPMADDWARTFGGDGHVIAAPVAFGVSLAAIRALDDRLNQLESRVH